MKSKVLLTGSSGFLGSTLHEKLQSSEIDTLARSAATFCVDICSPFTLVKKYDVVIHAAGKAHSTQRNLSAAESFFQVNVDGTRNLLTALSQKPPSAFIFISSVAVYGLIRGINISEEAPLLATDPYGMSKIEAEREVHKWCQQHGVICGILRLPLLAGPRPPGNLGAMINGIRSGYYFDIGKGMAQKSMVLAEDIAKVIPVVAKIGGTYNFTDGYHPRFHEVSTLIASQLNKRPPGKIPLILAKLAAKFGDVLGSKAPINSDKLEKICSNLTFDDSKARKALGWDPIPVLKGLKII